MKDKRNPKEKVKKILFSFWFWVIIALLFSYFILNLSIGQIIWIIIVIIIGTAIIQSIQKSSIGDYWKISWTILGIIGILALIFFSIKEFNLENSEEGRVKDMLEKDGYEVLNVHLSNFTEIGIINETWASVDIKSLGDLNDQAWDGLISLAVTYREADKYIITILTPTNKCDYFIDGDIYRASNNNDVYPKDRTDVDSLLLYDYLKSQNGIEIDGKTYIGIEIDSFTLYKYLKYQIAKETKSCS